MKTTMLVTLAWLVGAACVLADVPLGKFSAKAEEPTIRSLEFVEGGMVDVTSLVQVRELKYGRINTVSKTSIVRLSFIVHNLQTYDIKSLEAEANGGPNIGTKQLTAYRQKGYEEMVVVLQNKGIDIFVRKGNELIAIPDGQVYKKPWW